VTGIVSDPLHAGPYAYVTGVFRESPEKSFLKRNSKMYKLQGRVINPPLEFVHFSGGGSGVMAPVGGI
jgi:hypothetical protein